VGKRLTERRYFEHEHVLVSYNADLRGIVEDMLQKTRKSRCSVASFGNIPAIVEGSALLATVPRLFAKEAVARRPQLAWIELPVALPGGVTELLWPSATDDDAACHFVRERVTELAAEVAVTKLPRRGART
jgi:LysR family transcriptional activator of mexEF-oprN operon